MKLKLFRPSNSSTSSSNSSTSSPKKECLEFKSLYSIRSTIGQGTFSEVFCVRRRKDKTKFAAKVIKNVAIQDKVISDDKTHIPIEIWALRRLAGHVNIVSYHEHHIISDKYVIVLDYLRGFRDLFDHIEETGKLSESRTKVVILQVVEAVGFCFKMGIDHRDIKEENVMYNAVTEQVKLTDFGSASILTPEPYQHVRGTVIYIPPEYYLKHRYYPRPAAVWAIGCLTYCCLTSFTPFTQIAQITNRGPVWSHLDTVAGRSCLDFVKCCLVPDEGARMKFCMMLHHVWIVGNRNWTDSKGAARGTWL